MGGCFGDSAIDRWLERQVDEYNGQKEDDNDEDIYGDDDD